MCIRDRLWQPLRVGSENLVGMGGTLHVIGRLAPRATFAQAQADVSAIAARIEQTLPLLEATVRDVRPLLLVLFGAVTLLLFVACGNVATLAISRTVARQAEFTVRRALGATNVRLVGQLFIESAVLASLGGIAGMLLAWWGTGAVQAANS